MSLIPAPGPRCDRELTFDAGGTTRSRETAGTWGSLGERCTPPNCLKRLAVDPNPGEDDADAERRTGEPPRETGAGTMGSALCASSVVLAREADAEVAAPR